MPTLPIPNRCLWCLSQGPGVKFDASHVLPECVGNERQQVLPPGVVCKQCNAYFGGKVEPALLDYPLFHVIAAFLRVVDPADANAFRDQVFDATHPPAAPPTRTLNLKVHVQRGETTQLTVDVRHVVEGRLSRNCSRRELGLLSRAIHKIAFESMAWGLFVKGVEEEPVDLFAPGFDAVRGWARKGQPQKSVRPILWRPPQIVSPEWESRAWRFENEFGVELRLFGDWYGVSLTAADATEALADLQVWAGKDTEKVCCISNTISWLADA